MTKQNAQQDPVAAWAAREVAAATPAQAPAGISEEMIAAKTAAGLERAQAIEVLARQAGAAQNPKDGKK